MPMFPQQVQCNISGILGSFTAAMQACLLRETVKLCSCLSPQHRSALMQHEKLQMVQPQLAGDWLSITGCKELVSQV